MSDMNDDSIWQGLRRRLDDLGRLAPSGDLARVTNLAARPSGSRTNTLASLAGAAIIAVAAFFALRQAGLLSQPAGPGSTATSSATSTPSTDTADALHRAAETALDAWARAVADAPTDHVVIISALTGQVGSWEDGVGDNNKVAVLAGRIVATQALSDTAPPPGEVRWAVGGSLSVALLSADDALRAVITSADSTCPECMAVEVTSATLASASVQTSRGVATVPVWEFTVTGSSVRITRVAIAGPVSVSPHPGVDGPGGSISIQSAIGIPESELLTVSFVGAPLDASGSCGADYTAEAVESDLAIVVLVTAHPHPAEAASSSLSFGCRAVGAIRTAVVTLASPLGERTVLEVREGMPVPVAAP